MHFVLETGKTINRLPFVLLFCIVWTLRSSQENDNRGPDPRLSAILAEIKKQQSASKKDGDSRIRKYIADLRALEKKTSATGDLDMVLQVSKERESWESGNPTPSINPQDNSVLLDLRKLRYYFDQELSQIRAAGILSSNRQNHDITKKLETLVQTLTKEGKISQAVEVRKVKEQFIAGVLKIDSSKEATIVKDTPKPMVPNPGSETPDAPTQSAKKSRIVAITLQQGEQDEKYNLIFDRIAQDDLTDIVSLGSPLPFNHLVAIRDNGTMVAWQGSKARQDTTGDFVWAVRHHYLPPIGLQSTGQILAGPSGETEFKSRIEQIDDAVSISASNGVLAAVREDGSIEVIGKESEKPFPQFLKQQRNNVSQIFMDGNTHARVLTRDGKVIDYRDNSVSTLADNIATMHTFHFGKNLDGELIAWGPGSKDVNRMIGAENNLPESAYLTHDWLVLMYKNGERHFWTGESRRLANWKRDRNMERAIHGATQLRRLAWEQWRWLVVLIPADSVPRSGLWEVHDLVKARTLNPVQIETSNRESIVEQLLQHRRWRNHNTDFVFSENGEGTKTWKGKEMKFNWRESSNPPIEK